MSDDELFNKIRARRRSLGLPEGEPMSHAQIRDKIEAQRQAIQDTKTEMGRTRGVIQDVLQIVLPVFEEQLDILDALNDEIATGPQGGVRAV